MRSSPIVPREEGPRHLSQLAANVRLARQVVQDRRMYSAGREDLRVARVLLLQATEIYASQLTARRLPIPHRLRDDLRLQRAAGRIAHRDVASGVRGPTARQA